MLGRRIRLRGPTEVGRQRHRNSTSTEGGRDPTLAVSARVMCGSVGMSGSWVAWMKGHAEGVRVRPQGARRPSPPEAPGPRRLPPRRSPRRRAEPALLGGRDRKRRRSSCSPIVTVISVVGASSSSTPSSRTDASTTPRRVSAVRAWSSSSRALDPLRARSVPRGSSSGRVHSASCTMLDTARAVTHGRVQAIPQRLGSRRVHGDVGQAELGHSPGEPAGAASEGLDEVQVEVGSGDREGEARQTGAAPDVDDVLAPAVAGLRDGQVSDGAVEHVPVPQTRVPPAVRSDRG